MSRAKMTIITNMCMVERPDDYILVQDRQGKAWPGVTFPGGHVEDGESFHDSVVREVLEETGLTIRNPKLCGIKQFITESDERYIVLLYKVTDFTGELQSSPEGEVFWIKKDELKHYKVSNDFMEMYEIFINPELSEFFYELNEDGEHWDIKLY